MVSSHHRSPAERGGVRLSISQVSKTGQPNPNFMTSYLLKSKPNAGRMSELTSLARLRSFGRASRRAKQTRNGFGQSYVRPVVSAPLRTAAVDRVAGRASRPLPRPAWQIFSKAYHHRRSLSVFFVTTISQDTHIIQKTARGFALGAEGRAEGRHNFIVVD